MSSPSESSEDMAGDGAGAVVDLEKEAARERAAGQAPLQRVVTAQDWTGPDDSENPMNWPMKKRVFHTMTPAVMGFASTIGSSIYVPGIPDLMREMNISQEVAIAGLSMWVIGLGFGPVLAAPLSEKFGRTVVYRSTLFVSALFTIGAGFSTNPAALLVLRFFGGCFASPVLAVGAGTIADLWQPVNRATGTAFFVIAPFWGPALGPVVGGFAQQKGWRWTQWVTVMFEGAAWIMAWFMSETHKPIILKRRAKRLDIPPPPKNGPEGAAALRMILLVTLLRPLYMLVTEPIVGFFSLYIAFNFSVLFAFFDAFPIVFSEVYGFDVQMTGLTWLAVFVGCALGLTTFVVIDKVMYRRRWLQAVAQDSKAMVAPEHRLYASMIGSLGIPVGLFWLAWTARSDIHWISPVLAAIPFAWGNYNVFTGCIMYLIDTYGSQAGASASAANGLLRYVLGGVFPLFTTQMYTRLGINWATSLLGFFSILMLPIPWILYKFGPGIRARSSYTPNA